MVFVTGKSFIKMLLFQLLQFVNTQAFGSEGPCTKTSDCSVVPGNFRCLNGICYSVYLMEEACGECAPNHECLNNFCTPSPAICPKNSCNSGFGCVNSLCVAQYDSCANFTGACGSTQYCNQTKNTCVNYSEDYCRLDGDCSKGESCHQSKCKTNFILTWYNFYVPVGIGFFGIGNILQKVFENAKLKQKWKRKRDELKKKTKDNK